MVSDLVENLTREVMLELAGETYFERGEGYYNGGHVYDLVEHGGVIVAKVAGTEDYRVRLWAEDGLAYSCDCPLGLDGEFCKHCVAAGLAWLEGDNSEDAPGGSATMDDVRTYLEDQDKDLLVRIVMEQAMEDEGLRERLLLRASRMGGLDLAAFRRAVDDAVDSHEYPVLPRDHIRGIQNVIGAIAELLEEGFATEVVELSEYALAKIKDIMDYAVDGTIYGILEDLHHEACKQAKPDPEVLAKRLFEWELGGDYGTFFDAVNTYADVLGERGLAEYRRLAEKEWADVPALGPDPENRPRYYGKRERLADIMQTLAYRSGDVEALVAVKSKDLSNSGAYLEIARICKQAGDDEKALEWAEEGAWVFAGGGHPDLRRFLADEYHDRGRHGEANVEEAWRQAKEGGCSDRLWLDLAARREEGHPEDALNIYQERIEPLVNQTDNKAYRKAYELLLKVHTLMCHLGREAEFEEYVELLRLEYKRKRNFMKLLDGME